MARCAATWSPPSRCARVLPNRCSGNCQPCQQGAPCWKRTWKTQLIRMLAPRTLLLLGLAAPVAAFGVSARGLSPAKASVRSPAPQLVLGRVKSFVSNRIVSPFKKGSEEEDGEQKAAEVLAGESMVADAASLEIPPPMPALDKKNISAVDAFLVRLGVKTEDECTIPEEGEDLMEQIKCAGRAGIISYILWEWACARSPLKPLPLALAPSSPLQPSTLATLSLGPRAAVRWIPPPHALPSLAHSLDRRRRHSVLRLLPGRGRLARPDQPRRPGQGGAPRLG